MTFAHISDTHLGFRAYGRSTPQGLNQREMDVMVTFRNALEAMLLRDPDVVVHSGDLFHVVRPSNATIVETFRTLWSFQARRGGKPFVLIGGNHDSPRTSDSGNLLKLFAGIPGMRIETGLANAFEIEELDLEVLCVPSNSLLQGERVEYAPTFGRKFGLLTLHGMAAQALPENANFDVEDTRADRWTYVALGDYHVYQAYGKNVCYAGSTDFTSTNIWEEAPHPKGWIWFDCEVGKIEFVPLEVRKVIDLPVIDARKLMPEQIAERMRQNAKWDDGLMPIVRQRVTNVLPEVRPKIPMDAIREIHARCLNYRFVPLAPDVNAENGRQSHQPITLEKSWEDHIAKVDLPAGLSRDALRDLGLSLLKEVADVEADPIEA
jgi:DNA repair protein SbcD/Mre11